MPTDVREIAAELHTQDNLATAHPLFVVEEKERVYGVDLNFCGQFVWFEEGTEVDSERAIALSIAYREDGTEPPHCVRIGYVDRWRFVTACFTRKGCQEYLAANGHNLNQPRIYVASAHRNAEWQAVRKLLMDSQPPTDLGRE